MYGEIILALITGGVVSTFVKGSFDLIRTKIAQKNAFCDTIKDVNFIYSEMDELKAKSECDRVLVIATKNGGGIPVPGASLYASILFETYDKGMVAIKPSWQNRMIDEAYVKMLLRLEEEGVIILETDKMGDGILKSVYVTDGIKKSVIAKIKATDKRYYYISCNFRENISDDLAIKVHALDVVAKIKDVI